AQNYPSWDGGASLKSQRPHRLNSFQPTVPPTPEQRFRILNLLSTLSPHHTRTCTRNSQAGYVKQVEERYTPLVGHNKPNSGSWWSGHDEEHTTSTRRRSELSALGHKYFFAINLYNSFDDSKILSMLTSLFTSAYVFNWRTYFPDTELKYPPSFDGRVIVYPGKQEIRDYFSWRQADTHINNLYNTTFWALVQQGGMTAREAETRLKGTLSKDKHEILFSSFSINYNALPERFKKGSILVREVVRSELAQVASADVQKQNIDITDASDPVMDTQIVADANPVKPKSKQTAKKDKRGPPTTIRVIHVDIIKDEFWTARPELLDS
ncbi:unnamed protein product, partial [Rhizoctonia solani]